MSRTPPPSRGQTGESSTESAVPTLRVMRLQSPELHQPTAGSLESRSLLNTALCLPDSLAVYVGETFTAYLGVLNVSTNFPIRRLTVAAQLQTPSTRWQLPSQLDGGNMAGGVEVAPGLGVDSIVSHAIEEPGQHILRVEVGYMTTDGGSKTFRKFYRFQVSNPLSVKELTVRAGDSSAFVSISVEYNHNNENDDASDALVISSADFTPADGFSAELVGGGSATKVKGGERKTAVELFDGCGRLQAGSCFRYLFRVETSSEEAKLRGIAAGDLLGKAVFTWRKAMGETGRIASSPIFCPRAQPKLEGNNLNEVMAGRGSSFVVHLSGLSVDVAAAAATQASRPAIMDRKSLIRLLPVTVEPIDPPSRMQLSIPKEVQFLVVNHSDKPMTLQLQLHLSQMTGMAICGPSFKSLGEVKPHGGSAVIGVRFLALAAGLLRVQGCCVVDLASGSEIPQPPLFNVFVAEKDANQ
jgi:hypothetical protein